MVGTTGVASQRLVPVVVVGAPLALTLMTGVASHRARFAGAAAPDVDVVDGGSSVVVTVFPFGAVVEVSVVSVAVGDAFCLSASSLS